MRRITDPILDDTVYFRTDRIYYQAAINADSTDERTTQAGWYIAMREGYAYGPFPDRDVAETVLEGLIKRLKKDNFENATQNRRRA